MIAYFQLPSLRVEDPRLSFHFFTKGQMTYPGALGNRLCSNVLLVWDTKGEVC